MKNLFCIFEPTPKSHFYYELFFYQDKLINNIDKLMQKIYIQI